MKRLLLPFFFLFLILAYPAFQLRLYLDDSIWLHLAIKGNLVNYFHYYGFTRPLTLLYYLFIFRVYDFSPGLAHLFPLFMIISTGIMLFYFFKKLGTSGIGCALISLLIILFPYPVESWAWLAANSALFPVQLFLIQLYIFDLVNVFKKAFLIIFTLQILSVFTYESAILMPISLSYLFLAKYNSGSKLAVKIKNYLLYLAVLSFPSLVYISSLLLKPLLISSRYRYIGLSEFSNSWKILTKSFAVLFSSDALKRFWLPGFRQGSDIIIGNWFLLIFLIGIIVSLISFFFLRDNFDQKNFQENRPRFFILSLFLSLIPLSWQYNYLSWRILYFPFCLSVISIALLIRKFTFRFNSHTGIYVFFNFFIKISLLGTVILLIFLNISILDKYREIYDYDQKIAGQIRSDFPIFLGDEYYEHLYIYIRGMPVNISEDFYDGDYNLSTFNYNWSGEYFLNTLGITWKDLALESLYPPEFKSSYSPDVYFSKRPLFLYTYKGKQSCQLEKCLQLNGFYLN